MDDLSALIPPQYLGAAVALLALFRALDGIVRLIPDRWLDAHTTTQAVIVGVRKLVAVASRKPAAPPEVTP